MKKFTKSIENLTNKQVLLIVVGSSILTGLVSIIITIPSLNTSEWFSGFLQNFATEMLGAFLTFILIDTIIGGREKREMEEKEELQKTKLRLIKRLRSPFNETTIAAANELRSYGWLEDGTLKGAYLSYANLEGVNLEKANLEGARLMKGKLNQSNLAFANLEGTTLKVHQLVQAKSLYKAIMPDGRVYDGRLNLSGDIDFAQEKGLDANVSETMAEFYGVSHTEYSTGQEWARENLETLDRSDEIRELVWWHSS